jgi:hypothetical protein
MILRANGGFMSDILSRMLAPARLKVEGERTSLDPGSDTDDIPLPPAPDLGIEPGLYWVKNSDGDETIAEYGTQAGHGGFGPHWLLIGTEIEERSDFFEVICPARRP